MPITVQQVNQSPLFKKFIEGTFEFDAFSLKAIGEIFRKAIVYEAKKDFARQGKSPYGPKEGLPDSRGSTIRPSFFDSFKVKINGKRFSITSTWPWIENLLGGSNEGPMQQFTQANPKFKKKPIPMLIDGKVIFRMAPAAKGALWIHPGYARHTFVQRGIARAKKELQEGQMLKILLAQVGRQK